MHLREKASTFERSAYRGTPIAGEVVMQRQEKGRAIALDRLIERKGKLWEVPSQSGKGKYSVG
jgi:hypothetical protein